MRNEPMFLFLPMTDASGNPVDNVFSLGIIVALPIIYLIIGYVMTVIGALIYDFVAKYTVGIQFEITEQSNS